MKAYQKVWNEKNKDKIRAQKKAKYEANKEEIKAKKRARYAEVKNSKADKARQKAWKLRSRYNLYVLEYETMHSQQAGLCAICGRKRKLHIDHCHATGRIRALLCALCNMGLGNFSDSPETIRAAADYVERYK